MRNRFGRDRTDALSALFMETARSKHAFTRIDDLLSRGWEEGFCRGLLMLGSSRVGKSHIVRNYMRLRVTEEADPQLRPNIVLVEVPPGCTLKSFVAELLNALGDPDPDLGSQTEKTNRVGAAIGESEVDLLIVDEMQRLIDSDTDKVKAEVASWLTAFLNRRLCPMLMVGEKTTERVFRGKRHTKGRTFGSFYIEPYDWAQPTDQNEFRGVLYLIDKQLGMDAIAGLGNPDTALRIYAYAEGLLGQAATLIDQARAIARRTDRPKLTHDLLAEAVDELRIGEERGQMNPFRVDTIENVRPADTEDEGTDVPRRGRRRATSHEAEGDIA